ncbi:unnamed protein product [Parascedosporium putredinis]|uniref:Uncharacterized protein n=1 Tax=Parascedosporium putredinis TaxID=1442378 RepID=A0A9P1ME63_9PEZI|nr:unnamed protein product [Parascedosporium putredinis]CAI8004990.1 unnamed protein product [Parascedosporium putredinis]
MADVLVNPIYFELGWSILSTICLTNVLFGILVVGITSFTQVASVPIITSVAGAIANGLCFFAFYDYENRYSTTSKAAASAVADIAWMVQEAGLSFYSFMILQRVLRNVQWRIFMSLFWTMIVGIVGIRVAIAVTRIRLILSGTEELQGLVNHLHIGYFVLIALLECLSAYFLLTIFAGARRTSLQAAIKTNLFQYLMRSTEIRLALLAVLGTMRAVTYSFQASAQSATNIASQLDRFAYTLECMFPIMMFIDILASKLVRTEHETSSRSRGLGPRSQGRQFTVTRKDEHGEHVIEERIIEEGSSASTDIGLENMNPARIGISKTVEFKVYQD